MEDWSSVDGSRTVLIAEARHQGVTTHPSELIAHIHQLGWRVDNLKWKKDSYVARATHGTGEKQEAMGHTPADALARLLLRVTAIATQRGHQARLAASDKDWIPLTSKMSEIAQSYAKASVYEVKAALAWHELAIDSQRRAKHLQEQIFVEVVDDPEPYKNPEDLCKDVREKEHLLVSTANSDHPIWTLDDVINFRIVHMIMGYAETDAPFGWEGEVLACSAHAKLLSTNAQRALLTDRLGQLAYAYYYGSFQPKIAFIKDIEKQIGIEKGESVGIHPSQTMAPVAIPRMSRTAKLDYVQDPNYQYESGVQPLYNNGFMHHRDPTGANQADPLGMYDDGGTMDMAHLLQRPWSTQERSIMKQAVINALRTVLLSPRKKLRWNAIHAQHLMEVPSDVSDPEVYWNTLDAKREAWNQARGFAPGQHRTSYKSEQRFWKYVHKMNKDKGMSEEEARAFASRKLNELRRDAEDMVLANPKSEKWDEQEIELKVESQIGKLVERILKPKTDEDTDFSNEMLQVASSFDPEMDPNLDPSTVAPGDKTKYGAFFYGTMKSIAAVSEHADEITDAALEDVQQHNGAGWHFRSKLLSLNIPGVGPKVASFAWLLLQPTTSQLATIDVHMAQSLGRDYNKEMSTRDYYSLERQLAARRDAAGYGSAPLGAFQWGVWDMARSGPGVHQDHSSLAVLNPVPHHDIQWQNAHDSDEHSEYPEWWNDTQPHGDAIRDAWMEDQAKRFPKSRIPGDPITTESDLAGIQTLGSLEDEFCVVAEVPRDIALKIYSWVERQEWPEGTEIVSPDEYHITLLYSNDGWNDDANHIWIKDRAGSNFNVNCEKLDLFGPDKDVAVIRCDAPELGDLANLLIEEGQDRGLDVSTFAGGYKAHITIAENASKLPTKKALPLQFRTGPVLVCLPRAKPRLSSAAFAVTIPWHVDDEDNVVQGRAGQTIMQHLNELYGMTPEQIWEWNPEVGKQ